MSDTFVVGPGGEVTKVWGPQEQAFIQNFLMIDILVVRRVRIESAADILREILQPRMERAMFPDFEEIGKALKEGQDRQLAAQRQNTRKQMAATILVSLIQRKGVIAIQQEEAAIESALVKRAAQLTMQLEREVNVESVNSGLVSPV